MTKQEALVQAHMIAAKAIRTALAGPEDVLGHLDQADVLDVKELAERLEGNHWHAARRLNGGTWPTGGTR